MINPFLDITKVSYSSKKPFNLLLINNNDINIVDIKECGINALSFNKPELNINENWINEIASQIEGLRLNTYRYPSLKDICKFNNLQYFQLLGSVNHGEIPFAELDKLRDVHIAYQKKTCRQIFFQEKIEYLTLSYYKDKLGYALTAFKNLKQLDLEHFILQNLDCISNMDKLRTLSISYNSKITEIGALLKLKKTLKSFGIQNCKKITDWHILQEMKRIEFLYIENCGVIESLDFLVSLPNLKMLYIIGSTKIRDGKLKNIINKPSIEKANIAIQKNYDITRDDVRKFDFVPFIKID